jgi:hypothetical protein
MITSRKTIILAAAVTAFTAGLCWNGTGGVGTGFFSEAEARIGRPLTPMSYAGVARRTTRRAVAVGAAAGVAAGAYYAPPGAYYAPPAAYYAPTCVQVVDAYGRVMTRC